MKRYLLDTHILITAMQEPERLPKPLLDQVFDPASDRTVSLVSALEIAVKNSIGKLPLPEPFERDFEAAFEEVVTDLAAAALPITISHIARLRRLPLVHRDPFDRLIIAQALEENLTLVSSDRKFAGYAGLDVLAQ